MLQNHEKIIQRQKFQINNPSNYHGTHVCVFTRGGFPRCVDSPTIMHYISFQGDHKGSPLRVDSPNNYALRIMNYELP